jgi:hypothetical protein
MLVIDSYRPFKGEERDRILEWYCENNRFWFPFLYLQFWVGTRPSEAIALREAGWGQNLQSHYECKELGPKPPLAVII